MQIAIAGSSGLVGTALVEHLRGAGHHIVRLVRSTPAAGSADVQWDPASGAMPIGALDGADAVINLSGAGIGDHRWSDAYKRELVESRLRTTELLAATIAATIAASSASARLPAVFLSGSAIGWYGPRGDEPLDETSAPGSGFLSELCTRWEAATTAAAGAGVRTVQLRTGIVLSARGGALRKQLPLFKMALGGRFGSGRQWQSWISIFDEVGAIEHLLSSALSGPVNLTAPHPVTNRELTDVLGSVLRRPTVLQVPAFGPRLLLGRELADALLFSGQRVLPSRLLADGYVFRHSTLEPALRAILGR